MKKMIYTVAFVAMGITASYAQQAEKPKLSAEQRAEKAAVAMQQKLALTDEQKQKIQQIELDRIKKNDEWRGQDRSAMKDKMEERKAFAKANKDKIDAVLTADQKKILENSRHEMRDKLKDRRGKRGGRPGDKTPPPPPPSNN